MNPWLKPVAWFATFATGVLFWGAVICMASCAGEKQAPRGTAQDHAAGVEARARSTTADADHAATDAARLGAVADAASEAAQLDPSPAKIEAAAKARADALIATAVANAIAKQATEAKGEVKAAEKAAADERAAEQAAQDYRSWLRLCRLVGLACVIAGGIIGGLVGYLATARLGAMLGGLLVGVGCLVVAFGPATSWLPWAAPIAGAIVLGGWALAHRNSNGLAFAASATVDAVEHGAPEVVAAAKSALGKAVDRSGLRGRLDRARTKAKAILTTLATGGIDRPRT